MTQAVLRIRAAGPLVTVQDSGRARMLRYGVPASGPMDRGAFALARAALGPAAGPAGIEVSLGGLAVECVAGAVTLALAGGGFVAEVAGRRGGSWQVCTLRAGEGLTLRRGPWGAWCYVALAGRLRVPDWLGGQATHAASGLGGGILNAGQELVIHDAQVAPEACGPIPCPVWARPRHRLRCVIGPQEAAFAPETVDLFTRAAFHLTDAADRMGLRLRGPALLPLAALGLPSGPILRGAVQVAGDGVATVLMADHQTTGGYPRLATVLDCDLDGLAQARAPDRVAFTAVSPADAVAIARMHAAQVAAVLAARLGPPAR